MSYIVDETLTYTNSPPPPPLKSEPETQIHQQEQIEPQDNNTTCLVILDDEKDISKENDDVIIINPDSHSSCTSGMNNRSSLRRLRKRASLVTRSLPFQTESRSNSTDGCEVVHEIKSSTRFLTRFYRNINNEESSPIVLDDSPAERSQSPKRFCPSSQSLLHLPISSFNNDNTDFTTTPTNAASYVDSELMSLFDLHSTYIQEAQQLVNVNINNNNNNNNNNNLIADDQSKQKSIGCPICLEGLEEIRNNNKHLMATNCGHLLCNECLASYKLKSKTDPNTKGLPCPTCRKKLGKSKLVKMFL
jgi:hypothetical protein